MAERKPKLVLATNIPVIAVLTDGKPFWSGENEYGKTFAYNVKVNGEEFTYFANENAQEQLAAFGKGASVRFLMTEEKNKNTGKPYKTLHIAEALFEDNGQTPPPPAPNLLTDEKANADHRINRKLVMMQGLEDASQVARLFNETLLDPLDAPYRLTHEDVRAIGISFAISFERKSA